MLKMNNYYLLFRLTEPLWSFIGMFILAVFFANGNPALYIFALIGGILATDSLGRQLTQIKRIDKESEEDYSHA